LARDTVSFVIGFIQVIPAKTLHNWLKSPRETRLENRAGGTAQVGLGRLSAEKAKAKMALNIEKATAYFTSRFKSMKKIAITQSNYIPWKGYFDLIAAVDEFILYDDMQYTRRDWRNRNQIKTLQGVQWLTVPVLVKGRYHQKIRQTEIDGTDWAASHWKALVQNYRRAPHFSEIASWLEPLYLEQNFTHISQLNRRFIEAICNYLAIKTVITSSWDYASD
jgi:hypothetical protein